MKHGVRSWGLGGLGLLMIGLTLGMAWQEEGAEARAQAVARGLAQPRRGEAGAQRGVEAVSANPGGQYPDAAISPESRVAQATGTPEPAVPGRVEPSGVQPSAGETSRPVSPTDALPAGREGAVTLRVVALGDVNFNRNRLPVQAGGVDAWGKLDPWSMLTEKLAPLVDGDINIANIETVVTARNDFDPPAKDKLFCFRSHPNGVEQLIKARFNVFGLANNHAFDYGAVGIGETLKHMQAFGDAYGIAWSGIGRTWKEAAAPAIFEVKGVRVGFLSLGIGHGADAVEAGGVHISTYRAALAKLRDAEVSVRILVVHDGVEGAVTPMDRQIRVGREAIRDFKVNVVFEHHSHRANGVERYGEGVIYYGLGNGLMRGAADITGSRKGDVLADFGLLARVNLSVEPAGTVRLTRLEAVPIYAMHYQPRALGPEEAARRVAAINELSTYPRLHEDYNQSCPPPTHSTPLVFRAQEHYGVVEL